MNKNYSKPLININNEQDKSLLIEQYRILNDSLNKMHETRESGNTFWTSINVAIIAAVSYFRDTDHLLISHKQYFIWTSIIVGIILSASWLSYVATLKKGIEMRHQILIELEKCLPAKVFTLCLYPQAETHKAGSLASKEMIVPALCLIGYLFFGVLMCLAPRVVVQ